MRAMIAIAVGLVAAVLGYGWWHVQTHATFHMSLTERTPPARYGQVRNAQLAFLDANGNELAQGITDSKFGVVWVKHPKAGYCGPDLAQPAYRICFDQHATWLHSWVPQVRQVSLIAGTCRLERAPLRFSAYRDSAWTWWVPLRHIGGTPYTNYSTDLQVDTKACAVTGHRG